MVYILLEACTARVSASSKLLVMTPTLRDVRSRRSCPQCTVRRRASDPQRTRAPRAGSAECGRCTSCSCRRMMSSVVPHCTKGCRRPSCHIDMSAVTLLSRCRRTD
eukprot:IDg15978t1